MKKLIILLGIIVSIAATTLTFAQSTEGVIVYEVRINMHRTLPADRQEMKSMIPEFRTRREQLIFNENESLYKPVEEEEDDSEIHNQGMTVRLAAPQNEFYANQSDSRRLLLQEFMGKKYLISDSLKITPWKFGTEKKQIKGHDCKQAMYVNERNQSIVAWYAEGLRPLLGPEGFNTLPGGVLQVDINDGERTITASTIEFRPLKKNELKMSSGGIKTTQQEFEKIRDEQLERMRKNGANVIIRN